MVWCRYVYFAEFSNAFFDKYKEEQDVFHNFYNLFRKKYLEPFISWLKVSNNRLRI